MSLQVWKCDGCGKSGRVRFKSQEGPWDAIEKLSKAHLRLSRKCHDNVGIGKLSCKNYWKGIAK